MVIGNPITNLGGVPKALVMVRRRFFLFRVILSCWAGRGKTPGKAAKAKERATQEKDSNLEEKDSSLSISVSRKMRPYYYHLGGGVRRDTLVIGNPMTNTGGGVLDPQVRELT